MLARPPSPLIAASADTRKQFTDLFSLYVPVGIAVFVIVVGVLGVALIRGRRRSGASSSRVDSPRLELGYVVVLAVIAILLGWRTLDGVRADAPVTDRAFVAPGTGPKGLTIRAVAAKWDWAFAYPGGVVQEGRGPSRPATLVVPSGAPVRFALVSRDVEHAFWIPAARYKYDAVPGRTNRFDMEFEPGVDYSSGRCSEFCGQYHAQMLFRVDVRSPASFRRWLALRQETVR